MWQGLCKRAVLHCGEEGHVLFKMGICGKKPFHCLPRHGCQSECNNDMDIKLEEEDHPEPPVPVIKSPAPPTSKIIIKTITPSVGLCRNCVAPNNTANATKPVVTAPTPPVVNDTSASLLRRIAGNVPSIQLASTTPQKTDPSNGMTNG